MFFPFLYPTLSLAAGILLSSLAAPPLAAGILPMIFCLACAWIFFLALEKTAIAFAFILLAFFFLGSSMHTYQNDSFETNSLKNLKSDEYIDFQGRLYKSISRGRESDFLFLRVEKVAIHSEQKKMRGNLRISVPHTQEMSSDLELCLGDEIRVSAKLSPSQGYRNFGPPALEMYLKNQNIHNRAFTKSPMLIEKLRGGNRFSLLRIISIIRGSLQRKIEHHFSDPQLASLSSQGAVVEALLLGERGRLDPEISNGLQHAGIFHLFAISGAHIAIISFLLFSFLRFLRLPDRTNFILLIFLLISYALLVEGRPSVMRATIMALAFLVGRLIWRKANLLNTLSISAFIILVFNPAGLFFIGFQMTFAATLSIILFFPKVIPFLPRLPLRISEMFALSLTAQLGVMPFVASSFNRIVFSSLILNIAAIPLVGLTMAGGYIFLLFSMLSPFLAGICAKLIHFLVNGLIAVSHFLDPIPGLSFRIPDPPHFVVLGYFVFLGLMLIPAKFRLQKALLCACFAVFFVLLVFHPFPSYSKNLKLTFIDVGQGDSILVEFPGTKKMLVDGGGTPEDVFDVGERIVSPLLWQKGIRKIDYLVLTHAHPDHMNGLKAVARNFRIKEFWEAFSPENNRSYEVLRERLSDSTSLRRMFRGHGETIEGVKVEVLNPERADPVAPKILNDQSLVLRVSFGKTAFFLAADIGNDAEKIIANTPPSIRSDVLKSPHHGSDSSSSVEFLFAVDPRFVVLTVGKGNRYNLPDEEVVKRYQDIGARVLRTDRDGAVEFSSDGERLSFRTSCGDLGKDGQNTSNGNR